MKWFIIIRIFTESNFYSEMIDLCIGLYIFVKRRKHQTTQFKSTESSHNKLTVKYFLSHRKSELEYGDYIVSQMNKRFKQPFYTFFVEQRTRWRHYRDCAMSEIQYVDRQSENNLYVGMWMRRNWYFKGWTQGLRKWRLDAITMETWQCN